MASAPVISVVCNGEKQIEIAVKMKLQANLMICEIPNVALRGAAGNGFYLDKPEELNTFH